MKTFVSQYIISAVERNMEKRNLVLMGMLIMRVYTQYNYIYIKWHLNMELK